MKYYNQIQALRDVTQLNFPAGQIRYQWNMGNIQQWNPNQSFFKIRVRLTKPDGTALDNFDGIGYNMFLGDSLFQAVQVKINEKTVNKQDDYIHQIAAIKSRMTEPDQWLETIGNDFNFTSADLSKRVQAASSQGNLSDEYDFYRVPLLKSGLKDSDGDTFDGVNTFEIIIDTGVITFAANGGTDVDMGDIFLPGDILEFPIDAENNREHYIESLVDANNVRTNKGTTALAAAQLDTRSVLITRKKRSKRVRDIEIIWRPCLGFFDLDVWLPGGLFEIILTPNQSGTYKKLAIESFRDAISGTANNTADFDFNVINMEYYIAKRTVSQASSTDMNISFDEIRCQATTLNTGSLTQKTFMVEPYTHSLAIAYQDNRAGLADSSLSRGKFKIKNNLNPIGQSEELNLVRMFVQYGGQTLPDPIPDIEYKESDNKNYLMQRYAETQLYTNGIMNPSVEPFQRWLDRGPYYYWRWDKFMNRQSEVIISSQFSPDFSSPNKPQLLVFEWCKKQWSLKVSNNKITDLSLNL